MKNSQQYLNTFEIEERIEQRLPTELIQQYRAIRQTKAENIQPEERLEQTQKRIEHWNNLSDKIFKSVIQQLENSEAPEDNMSNNNNANDIATAITSAISLLLEQQKTEQQHTRILQQTKSISR